MASEEASGLDRGIPPLRQPSQLSQEERNERSNALPSNEINNVAFGSRQPSPSLMNPPFPPVPYRPGQVPYDPNMMQQMQAMMQQNQQLQAMLQNRRPDGMETRPPPRASKSKSKKGGYSQRFSTEETDLLLNLIEEQMPMGQECWLKVLNKFNH